MQKGVLDMNIRKAEDVRRASRDGGGNRSGGRTCSSAVRDWSRFAEPKKLRCRMIPSKLKAPLHWFSEETRRTPDPRTQAGTR